MSLAARILMPLQGSVGYAFQQIHRVAYTAIGLNPNDEQRHITAQMVEGGQVQVFVTPQYRVHIGYRRCGPGRSLGHSL